MSLRPVRIVATGKYLPDNPVTAADLEAKMGLEPGWVARRSGVAVRYFAKDETASQMGAKAAQRALDAAGLAYEDLDCIVGVSGTQEQAIPCGAALVQRALGKGGSGTPAFDVNSTCLSFVTGLDTVSYLIAAGRYNRVMFVASEIASVALDWKERESATILGDGAAAVIVERAELGSGVGVVCARMETLSDHAELTQTRGGGTKHHPRGYAGDLAAYTEEYCLFEMDGKAVFKLSANVLPGFVERMFTAHGLTMEEIDLVIPHQASPAALWLMQRRLGIPEAKWMVIAHDHGNTVAASIPLALHEAVAQGRLQRGQRVMLLGTSAGFSMGALVLDY